MLKLLSIFGLGLLVVLPRTGLASQRPFLAHPIDDVEAKIQVALAMHDDPVDAMLYLHPELKEELFQSRLLELLHPDGQSSTQWLEEGDKMRLRRKGIGFIDWTDASAAVYDDPEPRTPNITHVRKVKPLCRHLSTVNLMETLERLTAYHNRFYNSATGAESQRWLYDEITDIVRQAPASCRLSIEQFPHSFPQNSIIARFTPSGSRNASSPVTIIGAHLDSVNWDFPLLSAPGADDDASGTATTLEVFRVLVRMGYEPIDGPVEFHWWAGEEAGLLGSQDVARYYRETGVHVGGILNLDEVAYIKRNSTPKINLITVGATKKLSEWVYTLAETYADRGVKYSGMVGRSLDHQAWTRNGYPAVSIVEGDQAEGGWLPFPHSVLDETRIPADIGDFSYEHMLQFGKVAMAFVIEQAGMVDHNL